MTTAEEKAATRRATAFQELDKVAGKMLAEMVATIQADFCVPLPPSEGGGWKAAGVMLHLAPNQLSELVAANALKVKQLEILVNVLLNLLLELRAGEPLPEGVTALQQFLDRCTEDAEANFKMLNRALLSQGQVREHGGIIRPS